MCHHAGLYFHLYVLGRKDQFHLGKWFSKLMQAECDWNLVCAFSGVV